MGATCCGIASKWMEMKRILVNIAATWEPIQKKTLDSIPTRWWAALSTSSAWYAWFGLKTFARIAWNCQNYKSGLTHAGALGPCQSHHNLSSSNKHWSENCSQVEIKPLKLKTTFFVSSTWSQFSFKLLSASSQDSEYSQVAVSRCNEALALFGADEAVEAVQILEDVAKRDPNIAETRPRHMGVSLSRCMLLSKDLFIVGSPCALFITKNSLLL